MTSTKCGFDDQPNGAKGNMLLCTHGPTLLVNIGFDPVFDPLAVPITKPNIPAEHIHALVDTGAGESCIDSALAMVLNLPIVDRKTVSGSAGAHDVNVHLAHIHVPLLNFCAVDLAAGGQAHLALIGRTFLQHFTMTYDGKTGTVILDDGKP
jgi:predicted aspartyl protease